MTSRHGLTILFVLLYKVGQLEPYPDGCAASKLHNTINVACEQDPNTLTDPPMWVMSDVCDEAPILILNSDNNWSPSTIRSYASSEDTPTSEGIQKNAPRKAVTREFLIPNRSYFKNEQAEDRNEL